MQLITYDYIMSKEPCYDPIAIGMPIDYAATPAQFIFIVADNYRGCLYRHSVIEINL